MFASHLVMLIASALAPSSAGRPSDGPFRIVDDHVVPCLVRRGSYCIPDHGLEVSVYSSDTAFEIIVRVRSRVRETGPNYIIESGRCDAPSVSPRLLARGESYRFEGEDWESARFRLSRRCTIRLLYRPAAERPHGNGWYDIIGEIRPCTRRGCLRYSIANFL
ncbi:MAG: hypothetical protein QOC65_1450 [Sphingomonadales bacterium]|nr:hypothetical protein [Sphingomonadales bacterium]